MAKDTPLQWRKLNIYSIFLRNFSNQGTFNAVHSQLDRIKHLGTDVIWFLPFYPIGEEQRKGTVGSPYAIKDYRKVDPEHGTIDDFKLLVKEIHKRGMKVMIDIVLNHTSPDSLLANEHPEWFYKNSDGLMGNRVGDWTDIVDLDYSHSDLWDYHLETLTFWAEIVDGFRCDVASLIPIDFWKKAREKVDTIKPDFIWLSETIERDFIKYLRQENLIAHSDSEIYEVFDITYTYDTHKEFKEYLAGDIPLSTYVHAINLQDSTYPSNYIKMHFLENHDQDRIANYLDDIEDLAQWTAFNYLQKGATLIYNGQEVASNYLPSLFEKEPIDWDTGINLSGYMCHLAAVKKQFIPVENVAYHLEAIDDLDTVVMYYQDRKDIQVGIFNLKHREGSVPVDLPDGEYLNLLNNHPVVVEESQIALSESPIFIVSKK